MTKTTLFTAALAALLLSACGGPAATRADAPADAPKAAASDAAVKGVEARAQRRWDLLVAGKPAEAWDFFTPGYRQIKPRDAFAGDIQARPVKWTKAVVQGSQCPAGEQYCDVTVEVSFKMESTLPGVGTVESASPVLERWIETDGNWYFVPKEVARN